MPSLSLPAPAQGDEPSFNDAVLANCSVRLLLARKDYESPHLVPQLVIVGKVLGVSCTPGSNRRPLRSPMP